MSVKNKNKQHDLRQPFCAMMFINEKQKCGKVQRAV